MPDSPAPSTQAPTTRPADATRSALLDAAIRLFGSDSYRGTSIRAIAQAAGTNVAAIAYHFGGKEGLRLACGEEIARRMGGAVQVAEGPLPTTPEEAVAALERLLAGFVHFLALDPAADGAVPFMLREIAEESPVVDIVYDTVVAPRHRLICALWEIATGAPAESETTRLTVFSMIGQALYFRIGRGIVARRLDWDELDSEAVDRIISVLLFNLHATIDASRRLRP